MAAGELDAHNFAIISHVLIDYLSILSYNVSTLYTMSLSLASKYLRQAILMIIIL